jgi:hypothetical protein
MRDENDVTDELRQAGCKLSFVREQQVTALADILAESERITDALCAGVHLMDSIRTTVACTQTRLIAISLYESVATPKILWSTWEEIEYLRCDRQTRSISVFREPSIGPEHLEASHVYLSRIPLEQFDGFVQRLRQRVHVRE